MGVGRGIHKHIIITWKLKMVLLCFLWFELIMADQVKVRGRFCLYSVG